MLEKMNAYASQAVEIADGRQNSIKSPVIYCITASVSAVSAVCYFFISWSVLEGGSLFGFKVEVDPDALNAAFWYVETLLFAIGIFACLVAFVSGTWLHRVICLLPALFFGSTLLYVMSLLLFG